MTRVVIRALPVRETSISAVTVLPPGTIVPSWSVVRQTLADSEEPYLVHFTLGERNFTCPLYAFQPRTASFLAEAADTMCSPSAVAV